MIKLNTYDRLSKPPTTPDKHHVYKNYALRQGRVYCITARGLQRVVPRGMRQQVVQAAHDDLGHFSVEKTLYRLCEFYWFPRMRTYVEKYIACCIRCLFNKKKTGRPEGFLHPITKLFTPFEMMHIDHLRPFPKSLKGNLYIFTVIDAFTKFTVLRVVKSTKAKIVMQHLEEIFSTYGTPKVLISDQGSSFTCKKFKDLCKKHTIRHVLSAVATPRANGQVERLNRTILGALLTSTLEEQRWDDNVSTVQFAINNVPSKTTNRTPNEFLYGFKPRHGLDAALIDEVSTAAMTIVNVKAEREEASSGISEQQTKSKERFNRKRKTPRMYQEGNLVLIEK